VTGGAFRVLGLITARGGSKGLPGKNLRLLGGKPLVAWSIEAARDSGVLGRVVMSTDDSGIAEAARRAGAEVPFMRPAALAGDRSPHIDVVLHAVDALEAEGDSFSHVLLLQPTSPFRNAEDIRRAVASAREHPGRAIVGVSEAPVHPQHLHTVNAEGVLVPILPPREGYVRRQDLEPVWAVNGALYLNPVAQLRRTRSFVPDGSLPAVIPASRSVDIDSEDDLQHAERLLSAEGSRAE
jgi:CMP-N-acetylneuraminic acid synthetase